jgi:hypothetical protein
MRQPQHLLCDHRLFIRCRADALLPALRRAGHPAVSFNGNRHARPATSLHDTRMKDGCILTNPGGQGNVIHATQR